MIKVLQGFGGMGGWETKPFLCTIHLRMYCIDTPGVPESSDAGTFHSLYD